MKIVLTTTYNAERFPALRAAFPAIDFVEASDEATIRREIVDADGVLGVPSGEAFALAKRLRWIQTDSAGVEWLGDNRAMVEADYILTNARGAGAVVIAEHTFALLLAHTRRIPPLLDAQREHRWADWKAIEPFGGIAGKTMGILGFGNIGRAIATRALAFELTVLAVDAHPVAAMPGVAEVWPLDRLNDLLDRSDIVVVTVPQTERTRGMIGTAELGRLKRGSYFIVVSRGGIVDEAALAAALTDGRLAGASLDVTRVEPLPSSDPLWNAPNLIITPHVAAAADVTNARTWDIFFENVGHFSRGEPMRNVVEKRLGY